MTTINVKCLPKDFGPAGWNSILPPAQAPKSLERNLPADWLVIGAGFAGLAAARRLGQLCSGDKIVVLEACRLAEGPVGRNSGFLIDLPHHLGSSSYLSDKSGQDSAQTQLNRAAIKFVLDAAADYGLARDIVDPCGKVNGAASQKGIDHNRLYADHLTRIGEPFSLLDERDMRDLTGSSYYLGGLSTPGTVLLQPAAYVRGVAAGLSDQVTIYEQSPVVQLSRQGGNWCANTPKGSIVAPKVILATNGHAESFGFFRQRLVHIHLFASMTRALSPDEVKQMGGQRRWGLTPSDPAGTTMRRISGNDGDRIVVRNRIAYTPSLETDDDRIASFGRSHDKSFARRFPGFENLEMEFRWGGRLCMSLNEAPAFGAVEDGIYAACCQNGLGAARGTLSGMLAAEFAADHRSQHLDMMLHSKKPTKLPPGPIARLGAKAAILWNEFRAGKEL